MTKLDEVVASHVRAVEKARTEVASCSTKKRGTRGKCRVKAREVRDAEKVKKRAAKALREARVKERRAGCRITAWALRDKRGALKAHKRELRQIERSTERRKRPLASAGERRSEARGAVEVEIPENLVPLWRRVGRSFRLSSRQEGRMSLAEAFMQWAAENPDQALAAQEADAAAEMRKLEREQRRATRGSGRRGRAGRAPRVRREDLPEAPF